MFTKPTIFSMNPATGQARCAGEAGDELMIGKETMLNMISQASGTSYLAVKCYNKVVTEVANKI